MNNNILMTHSNQVLEVDHSANRRQLAESQHSHTVPLHKLPISDHSRRIYLNQSADFLRDAAAAFPLSMKAQRKQDRAIAPQDLRYGNR